VSGCFVAKPIDQLKSFSGPTPAYCTRRQFYSSFEKFDFFGISRMGAIPQVPGKLWPLECGKAQIRASLGRIRQLHSVMPIDLSPRSRGLPLRPRRVPFQAFDIPFVVTVSRLAVFKPLPSWVEFRGPGGGSVGRFYGCGRPRTVYFSGRVQES